MGNVTDRWEYRSIPRLTGLLIATVIADVISTLGDVTGTLHFPAWNDLSAPLSGNLALGLLLGLVAVVLFFIWTHRCAANIPALDETLPFSELCAVKPAPTMLYLYGTVSTPEFSRRWTGIAHKAAFDLQTRTIHAFKMYVPLAIADELSPRARRGLK